MTKIISWAHTHKNHFCNAANSKNKDALLQLQRASNSLQMHVLPYSHETGASQPEY